jgi:hypothetical protein
MREAKLPRQRIAPLPEMIRKERSPEKIFKVRSRLKK